MTESNKQVEKTDVGQLIALERQKERNRMWRFLIILVVFVGSYGFLILLPFIQSGASVADLFETAEQEDYVAVVQIKDPIMPTGDGSHAVIGPLLSEAFKDEEAKGVIIQINSPGGTPVQSALIHDRIKRLKKKYPEKQIIAVGEDMMTSGAYMVAAAADKIYVNRSTMTGSIGVVMRGFGFPGLLEKLGVERRVHTSGSNKNMMDSFEPETDKDIEKAQHTLKKIHSHFISIVKAGRGERLKAQDDDIFTGEFWTGEEALEMGLVDGISDMSSVAKEVFKVEHMVVYTPSKNILEQIGLPFVGALSSSFSNKMGTASLNRPVLMP